jgi:serine/threonine-protein kinase PpkA
MTLRRRHLLATAAVTALPLPAAAQQPRAREALLMPGKRTLRQRILTKPESIYSPQPGAAPAGAKINPLTPLFVYARSAGPDGKPWLELGPTARGTTTGWLPEDRTILWQHTLTAAFHNPAGRPLTLFFQDSESLRAMLGGAQPVQEARTLAAMAERVPRPANFPVVAMEPAEHIDIKSQFYLLPIFQAESVSFQDGREYRMLEVASVPLGGAAGPQKPFTVGIAFVVDTTLSMDPYINKVRAALTDFVRANAAEPGAPTRFALIGYRNSLAVQPRLEYLHRTFARFADSQDADGFIRKIQDIKATNVDSLSFNEDGFAAIAEAIDNLDWGDIQGRVVILVTDAGNRPSNDPHSATRMRPEELGEKAAGSKVALFALHLKTPQGANNHGLAERQYTTLTSISLPAQGTLYYPVANGDAEALDRTMRDLLTKLRAVRADQSADHARNNQPNPNDRGALVGHAMRLAWLGRQGAAAAPEVIRAWAPDGYRGANPPECLDVRVLLTRNQLNDLAQTLRLVIDEGRRGIDPNAMFDRLQTIAAHLARDPDGLRQRGLQNLGSILGEYFDDLPYVSELATMDRAGWRSMAGGAQAEFLDKLESRLSLYQDYNRTPELWKSFDGGRDAGEAVCTVPLAALP